MVKIRWTIALFLILLCASGGWAREFDAFARVKVSPRNVVVRQPFRVTISVYTATWYTNPLQFNNLKIENAFIIPFTRTLSSIEYIQNKKYASLTFYYLVIPYETGELEIPALEITATTPPVGEYKGIKIPLETRAQRIEIKELPESEEKLWMVAKNVNYRESWNKELDMLKVGDVLERTIVLNASGTLPSLIQPLELEKPVGVSLYPAPPELKDTRTAQDVNGRRTEHYSYLFEEEGEVTFPEEQFFWWNPSTHRVYSRTIPERVLQIAPNPNLDMMVSLKDSLDALQASALQVQEEEPFPWKKYGLILLAGLLALYLLVRIILIIIRHIRRRRKAYLASSRYELNRCRRALRKKDARVFTNTLYTWVDRSRKAGQSAAVYDYLEEEEKKSFLAFMEAVISGKPDLSQSDRRELSALLKSLK